MKIRQISVSGLFEVFDHQIPLNEEGITIIHGPNGFGKTVLLRMIDGLFNEDYSIFEAVPFKEFSVTFDDGRKLSVEKADRRRREKGIPCFIVMTTARGKRGEPFPVLARAIKGKELERTLARLQHMVEGTKYDEEQERLEERAKVLPAWLKELRDIIHVNLINTQRLEMLYLEKPSQYGVTRVRRLELSYLEKASSYGIEAKSTPTIREYSREMATRIQVTLAQYAAHSQELDRTFPIRILQQEMESSLSAEMLTQKLIELEEKRAKLTRLGFLDPEKDNGSLSPQEAARKLDVLSVYVRDMEQKLRVFDEMAARIELFLEIVNHRFLYKKMTINREKGFLFTTHNGKQLEPESLSSGEQHELVLLYEMLFKVRPNSLILIDEPEISLHVAWQTQFLRDLKKLVDLSGFSVILATHSPQLISDRWDLTVELKGPPLEAIPHA